ncbi:MAG: CoA transferase [Deltaproteobacteria bacterium]|nr:CoA transferase [Deltaproteobacteria bacterium]
MQGILNGIKVLDLSRYIAGAYCAKMLADMGAEAIRVDDPGGSVDRDQPPFGPNGEPLQVLALNCNKRGVTLNLRAEKGRPLLEKLVAWADVVVENFSLPAKKLFGVTYEDLKAIRKDVILVSFSGYGSTGPAADMLAFDSTVQGETGIMLITGHPGTPPTRVGISIVDLSAGVHGALAATLALYHRRETGTGQLVEVALMDVATAMVTAYGVVPECEVNHVVRPPLGGHAYGCYAGTFRTNDGWIFISALNDGIWKRFLRVIGREDLLDDPRMKDDYSRYIHRDQIDPAVEAWTTTKSSKEAMALLTSGRVPSGEIKQPDTVAGNPQVKAREMIVNLEVPGLGPFPFPGVPMKFSMTPGSVRCRAPQTGEHNAEIYGGMFHYRPEEIEQFSKEGII